MSERSEGDAAIGNDGASNLRRRKAEVWRPDCSNRTAILNPVVAPRRVIQIAAPRNNRAIFRVFIPQYFGALPVTRPPVRVARDSNFGETP